MDSTKTAEDANIEHHLSVLMDEYTALKSEQSERIGFRDNLLYVTIGAVGGIASVALGGFGVHVSTMPEAFLLVPWVTAILGWTYIQNDQKITAIRQYIERELAPRIKVLIGAQEMPLVWERYHRDDPRRVERKAIQLAVDLGTFVFSGGGAIAAYAVRATPLAWPSYLLIAVEAIVLLILAQQFVAYSKSASQSK
jgi:hypothetical protein